MSLKDEISNAFDTVTATIANGATDSDACNMGGLRLFALRTPAALTGTSISFKTSTDGTTFYPLYNSSGTLISATVSTSRNVSLDPAVFAPFQYIKLVSGSAEGAARSIILILRPV